MGQTPLWHCSPSAFMAFSMFVCFALATCQQTSSSPTVEICEPQYYTLPALVILVSDCHQFVCFSCLSKQKMCITEIWTYYECGCHYLHPIPCYDRALQPPGNTYGPSENWALVSDTSPSSPPSVASKKADDPTRISSSHPDTAGSGDETDTAYNHGLHLVRTCSLRRTAQKTFLEPICDDCLLLELGLASENRSSYPEHDSNEDDDSNLDGAEWLLESTVEITVEPPAADDDDVFHVHSEPRARCSLPEDESEDETPKRGRGSRRAMELSRESLVMNQVSPMRACGSLRRLRQTGQRLRRARKQHDLKHISTASSSPSKPSSTRASSWIEHLKSDLGQRVRRKTHDIVSQSEPIQRSESSNDTSSSTTEDYRILSLSSIPASATLCTTSVGFEEPIILPLDQNISSSEFGSSLVSSTTPPADSNLESLLPNCEESARPSSSSAKSTKSFHTATSTMSSSSSPAEVLVEGGVGVGISVHPLSCPLLTSTDIEKGSVEDDRYENGRNSTNIISSKKKETDRSGEGVEIQFHG